MRSGMLINDGSGAFSFAPLPTLAQVSPCFGVVLSDVDADGHADLFLAQNFFSPQRETGRMAGGVSLLLRGNGDGTFAPVWPHESGVLISGDAASCVLIDMNNDGTNDILTGLNNDQAIGYENRSVDPARSLRIELIGSTGNPDAIGARVTLTDDAGGRQTAEVAAGSGYLSQSSPAVVFGLGRTEPVSVDIDWPDGRRTTHEVAPRQRVIVIANGLPAGDGPAGVN